MLKQVPIILTMMLNFNHIIKHALSCTLEEDGEVATSVSGLRFGTIHEVINVGCLRLH